MDWNTIISGFIGVLVGSVAPIIVVLIQSRFALKRDRARLAIEAALADFHAAADQAKHNKVDSEVAPLSIYILYHTRIMELVAQNRMNRETLQDLDTEQKQILRMLREDFYKMNPQLNKHD